MTPSEQELAQLIGQLTSTHSELAAIEVLPKAKGLYEELHPETRHGGERGEQVRKSRTWPSFAQYVADETGISRATIYRRIEMAEKLAPLDSEARAGVGGTRLANHPQLLARIAAIPKPELHRDVVKIFLNSGPKKGKEELQRWEAAFGLAKTKRPSPKPDPNPEGPPEPGPEEEAAPAGDDSDDAPVTHGDGAAKPDQPEVAAILSALEVDSPAEALEAIAALKQAKASLGEMGQLQVAVQELRRRNKTLEAEVALFRTAPIGKLFGLLGAKTVQEALRKAKALGNGVDHAPA